MSATGTRQVQADTRERVLDAAEILFGREGLSRPSVRQITSEAGVNVAAVNYHFGSREGLVEAVFERHASAVNAERIQKLDDILRNAGTQPPSLTAILEAYLEVRLRQRTQREANAPGLKQLFGHLLAEPPEVVDPQAPVVGSPWSISRVMAMISPSKRVALGQMSRCRILTWAYRPDT